VHPQGRQPPAFAAIVHPGLPRHPPPPRPWQNNLQRCGKDTKNRKVEDVRHELANNGHNIKAGVISMAMLKLTQQDKLARSKDTKGVFVYKSGSKT
jgi:hypothetical protein